MSRGEADLVAAIRGELAAVLPDRPCCRRVELDALADAGGRREEIAIARTIHRLSAALEGELQPRSGLGAATPAARAAATAERLSAERAPRHCRIAYLRGVFDKMVADPAMIDMAAKRGLELDPAPGALVQSYSDAIVKTPADVVEKAAVAFKG